MSAPLVMPADLDTYLGLGGTIDFPRAQMLLGDAQALCESVVSPLPEAASVIIRTAAARAYTNPEGFTSETIGPYNYQRPNGGVYLTRAERRALQTMSGRSGSFSIDILPRGAGRHLPLWAWQPDYRCDES